MGQYTRICVPSFLPSNESLLLYITLFIKDTHLPSQTTHACRCMSSSIKCSFLSVKYVWYPNWQNELFYSSPGRLVLNFSNALWFLYLNRNIPYFVWHMLCGCMCDPSRCNFRVETTPIWLFNSVPLREIYSFSYVILVLILLHPELK